VTACFAILSRQLSDRETDVGVDGEDLHARSEVGFGLGAADHGSGSGAIMVTLTSR
jgi:hypothetical protein